MLRKVKRIKLGQQLYRRLMKRVLERDGWRCQKCGSLENLQIHHQIKRSQQGNDSLKNLVTLCAYCHMAEHGQLFYSVQAVRMCSKPKLRGKRGAAGCFLFAQNRQQLVTRPGAQSRPTAEDVDHAAQSFAAPRRVMGLNASWPDGLPPVKPAAFGRGVQKSRIEQRESQTQHRGHRADVRN
jgi:hypothetical protein